MDYMIRVILKKCVHLKWLQNDWEKKSSLLIENTYTLTIICHTIFS